MLISSYHQNNFVGAVNASGNVKKRGKGARYVIRWIYDAISRLGRKKRKMADAFEEEFFPQGTEIVREGEMGDKFYILLEGECSAIQEDTGGQQTEAWTP